MGVTSSARLKELALAHGFETVGVTPALPIEQAISAYRTWLKADYHGEMEYLARHELAKSDPKNLLPSAKAVIALTANYNQEPSNDPKVARYALGRDYHKVLMRAAQRLMKEAMADHEGAEWRVCVDSIPIFERAYANLAGLGWFGKNTMLIDSKRGSWFFIVLVLTSVEFAPDAPALGGCGNCRACIDACPTGAIVQLDGRWQVDSRRCISYQTIEKKGDMEVDTAGWLFGCDVCQEVCPFNQPRESQPDRAKQTTWKDFGRRAFPELNRIPVLTHEEWDRLTQGSAIRRSGYEGLKRNARASLSALPRPPD